MESRALSRLRTGAFPPLALAAVLLAALYMMSAATQNSAAFGDVYSLLIVVNLLGVVALLALILVNLFKLLEQYRARALGTRLTLRLVAVFGALALLPVAVVFVFSVQTVNRGIDYWFDVKIERALDDALILGRTALDAIKTDISKSAQDMAMELETSSPRTVLPTLNFLREQQGVTELTLFSQDGKIIASSSQEGPISASWLPDLPSDAILARVRQGQTYASLDAESKQGFRVRVVVPVYARDVAAPLRVLQVIQALPTRYTKLAESVQSAYAEYEKLVYLRGPLKFSFTLTLSLVALLTVLLAVWAAIFSARRLVAPIRDLAEGTRAVAEGDYRTQIPVTTRDEIGLLVESFNDMTRRINRAQTQIRQSQQEAELQRAYLETVLAHLSSGVISLDAQNRLRTYNAAAEQVLAAALGPIENEPLAVLAASHPALAPFVATVEHEIAGGANEWQAEVTLAGETERRRLLVRGTRLAGAHGRRAGVVLVFDDVTALVQAQRTAAWGEVARRMAHEIKNPLTPIQLAAERIRHKFLKALEESERATLDRATRTIVDQVEALKTMVNAFTEYARPAAPQPRPVDLNDLIRDVVELHKVEQGRAITHRLALDPQLPRVTLDPDRMRQVLHNLLLNAHDALQSAAEPVIEIATRVLNSEGQDGAIELSVIDNGPGFPAELLPQLFEPYVTTKQKGTGLGLAIVKRIVEEHGGHIGVHNAERGGACVTVRLPIGQAASAAAPTDQAHAGAQSRRRVRGRKGRAGGRP